MTKRKKQSSKPLTQEDNSTKPVAQVPVEVAANACPKCGSTKRGKIYSTEDRKLAGIFRGQIYDWQRRRWCACANCGQRRVIVEHHRK
jgi:predicted RNA-binding Zn ribbon-like protein